MREPGGGVTRLTLDIGESETWHHKPLGAGPCGALTTDTTVSHEISRLFEDGARPYAAQRVVAFAEVQIWERAMCRTPVASGWSRW